MGTALAGALVAPLVAGAFSLLVVCAKAVLQVSMAQRAMIFSILMGVLGEAGQGCVGVQTPFISRVHWSSPCAATAARVNLAPYPGKAA